jgi:DNA-binding NarL/FixJ family response regulator
MVPPSELEAPPFHVSTVEATATRAALIATGKSNAEMAQQLYLGEGTIK